MNAKHIEILAHLNYKISNDYSPSDEISYLLEKELITEGKTIPPYTHYRLTERGKMFVCMLIETPLPELAFVDPRKVNR